MLEHEELVHQFPFKVQILHANKKGYIFTIETIEIFETELTKLKARVQQLKQILDLIIEKTEGLSHE